MANLLASSAGTIKLGEITVNRLGLGTNRISDNDASRAVLKQALELGINFIDTAHRYGQSEEIIGQTLAPYPPCVVIATKGGWSGDNSHETLQSNISQSLHLLKLGCIDLWQLHRANPDVPIEQTMEFLKSQQQAGTIKHIGLSEVSVEQIERARAVVPIASVQNHYNLVTRQHQDVLDYCTREHIAFIPFFPLGGGRAADTRKHQAIAAKYGVDSHQLALAWLLRCSPIMLPIPGTLSVEHLQSNVAAANIELSDQDYKELSNL